VANLWQLEEYLQQIQDLKGIDDFPSSYIIDKLKASKKQQRLEKMMEIIQNLNPIDESKEN
jgi:hypothetical protein